MPVSYVILFQMVIKITKISSEPKVPKISNCPRLLRRRG